MMQIIVALLLMQNVNSFTAQPQTLDSFQAIQSLGLGSKGINILHQ